MPVGSPTMQPAGFQPLVGNEPAHADTADLFIIREREVQRSRKSAARELRHEREGDRRKALHVGSPAAIQPPILQRRLERRRVPWLAVDGNDIGVPRQHDAVDRRIGVACRQRREQIGLVTCVIKRERRQRAERFEIGPRPFDEPEIRLAAGRVVGDPLPDQRQSDKAVGAGRFTVNLVAASSERVHCSLVRSIRSIAF
jgi:hypothetical protein